MGDPTHKRADAIRMRRLGALPVLGVMVVLAAHASALPDDASESEYRDAESGNWGDAGLDGKRLIAVRGAYGQDGTEDRTEFETFARITSYLGDAEGPETFVVMTPDRRTLTYGSSTATERHDTIRRAWALAEIRDRQGNTVRFSYSARSCLPNSGSKPQCFSTSPVLDTISYGAMTNPRAPETSLQTDASDSTTGSAHALTACHTSFGARVTASITCSNASTPKWIRQHVRLTFSTTRNMQA